MFTFFKIGFVILMMMTMMMAAPNNQQISQQVEEVPPQVARRRRRPRGTPDPECEIIALSSYTLLNTSSEYICEICGKKCIREQNLRAHQRIHNPSLNLERKITDHQEVRRKKAYICPETDCVHHNPSRALCDINSLKKHYLRKHGAKDWECKKCLKRYAVECDLKAHSKTCAKKDYKCDICGKDYHRNDAFKAHIASCEALMRQYEEMQRTGSGFPPAAPTPANFYVEMGVGPSNSNDINNFPMSEWPFSDYPTY